MAVIKYKDPTTGQYVPLSLLADLIEIVDGFTSTNTSSALSANSGRILNEKFANYITLTDNAASATKLLNARTINGVPFDGTQDITITAEVAEHNHGLLHSDFSAWVPDDTDNGWSTFNSNYLGFMLKSVRFQQFSPAWGVGDYGSGILFGGADTKGLISMAYHTPYIKMAGGAGTGPAWWIGLRGTSTNIYNLDTFLSTSGGSISGDLSVGGNISAGNILSFPNTGANAGTWRGIVGYIGDNDDWVIRGSQEGSNSGFLEIATGDDGTEPILVRQYAPGMASANYIGSNVVRTAYLLDANGNTSFPGHLYITNQTISGTLYGNSGNGLIIQSNNTGSWKEGIRIYSASNGYSTMYCGNTGLTNGVALVAGANNSTHYIDVIHGGVTYTLSLKAQTGTVALTSDIPSSYNYVHSGAWNISSWNESSLMSTSYAGSVYRTDIGSWWNMMNIRHRGGSSDGIHYGIQMVTSLTGADKLLEYRKNYGQNAWTNWVSICYSDDESVRNLYMNSISTWNSYYSGYPNGTIMFCWE